MALIDTLKAATLALQNSQSRITTTDNPDGLTADEKHAMDTLQAQVNTTNTHLSANPPKLKAATWTQLQIDALTPATYATLTPAQKAGLTPAVRAKFGG
jgi:hypothetical protein